MKEIIINYTKDYNTPNDYIVKRVIRQYNDDYFNVISYFMINKKLKSFPSKFLYTKEMFNHYIEDCKKSRYFKNIIEQEVLF